MEKLIPFLPVVTRAFGSLSRGRTLKISPVHIKTSIAITIVPILLMRPFLGEALSL